MDLDTFHKLRDILTEAYTILCDFVPTQQQPFECQLIARYFDRSPTHAHKFVVSLFPLKVIYDQKLWSSTTPIVSQVLLVPPKASTTEADVEAETQSDAQAQAQAQESIPKNITFPDKPFPAKPVPEFTTFLSQCCEVYYWLLTALNDAANNESSPDKKKVWFDIVYDLMQPRSPFSFFLRFFWAFLRPNEVSDDEHPMAIDIELLGQANDQGNGSLKDDGFKQTKRNHKREKSKKSYALGFLEYVSTFHAATVIRDSHHLLVFDPTLTKVCMFSTVENFDSSKDTPFDLFNEKINCSFGRCSRDDCGFSDNKSSVTHFGQHICIPPDPGPDQGQFTIRLKFPGGKMEEGVDESTFHAALREAYEEIGPQLPPPNSEGDGGYLTGGQSDQDICWTSQPFAHLSPSGKAPCFHKEIQHKDKTRTTHYYYPIALKDDNAVDLFKSQLRLAVDPAEAKKVGYFRHTLRNDWAEAHEVFWLDLKHSMFAPSTQAVSQYKESESTYIQVATAVPWALCEIDHRIKEKRAIELKCKSESKIPFKSLVSVTTRKLETNIDCSPVLSSPPLTKIAVQSNIGSRNAESFRFAKPKTDSSSGRSPDGTV